MKLNKMRQELADTFLAALKENKIPWHRDWTVSAGPPVNAVSGYVYHGLNTFWLYCVQAEQGYTDPRWCTFKQAAEQGWHIKKGEKGTKIEFWSMYDTETKKKISSAEVKRLEQILDGEEFMKRIKPISSVYVVFNGEQIEGIPEIISENYQLEESQLLSCRETLFSNMGLEFQEKGDHAYYIEEKDMVTMPPLKNFKSEYGYLSTLLHEAGHATGHPDRLDRDLSGSFGSEAYAKEELRAEIASAFTSQALGIVSFDEEHINNHKAYIQSWAKAIENNPGELFAAIRDAEKISDYLLEKGNFLEKYQKPLFTSQEAAHLRLIGKGRKNDFKSSVMGEIAKELNHYMEEGVTTTEIVKRVTPFIDRKFELHDISYTKNIISSILAHNREEYQELIRQPILKEEKSETKNMEENVMKAVELNVPSEMYGITVCVVDISAFEKGERVFPCGSGEDYKLTEEDVIDVYMELEKQKKTGIETPPVEENVMVR